jgi:hypothetical protein
MEHRNRHHVPLDIGYFNSGNHSNAEEKIIKIAEKKLSKGAKKGIGLLGLFKHSKDIPETAGRFAFS